MRKIKIIIIAICLIFLTIIGITSHSYFGDTGGAFVYSEGERTGYVNKVSSKGWIFKTFEGELNMGTFQRQDPSSAFSGSLFAFSVTNKDVIDQIQKAIDHNKKVKLYYRQVKLRNPAKGDSDYFVYKVEEIQ